MQVEPIAPSPITAAAAEAKAKDDPEAHQSSPGAKMHAVIGKVKDKAKKLKTKIKGKKETGPGTTDPEHEESDGEDEGESDQSSPYQNQQELKSDHPELNKGIANRDISGDKFEATPGATAPGTGAVQDPPSESAETAKFNPQSDSTEAREVDPRPDEFAGTPGKDAIETGAVQDRQSAPAPADEQQSYPQSASDVPTDPQSGTAETGGVGPHPESAEAKQFDPQSESADTEKYEDAGGDKGYKDRAYEGSTAAKDNIAGASAAAAGALGYKAYEHGKEKPLNEGEEKPSKETGEVDPQSGETGDVDPQFKSAESKEVDPQSESAEAKQFDPQSESTETREFDPRSTSAETDQQFDPKSESADTEKYEDAEGDKGYKDRAYEGATAAKDTIAGASAGAAGALGYKAYEHGEEKPSKDTREVDPQSDSADSREVDPQSKPPETTQLDPQSQSAETDQFDPTSESADTGKYEDEGGDKGYKDRAYEGASTAKDTIAGASAAAAGALGYKAYEQGGEKPSNEGDAPQSEPAETTQADPQPESGETDKYEDPQGGKGYKDRAYEGVTTARDTIAGAPAAAAGALGYEGYGQGEEKPLNEGDAPQSEPAKTTQVDPQPESGVTGETDKYEDPQGGKGYKDRADEGVTTVRDTVAGAPAAAAGDIGYEGYGQGEEKPLDEGDAPQSKSAEPTHVDPQSESAATREIDPQSTSPQPQTEQFDPKPESDKYEGGDGDKGYLATAKDTPAGAPAAAAGAVGYKTYGQGAEKSSDEGGKESPNVSGNAEDDQLPPNERDIKSNLQPTDGTQLPSGESKPPPTNTSSQPTITSRVLGFKDTLASTFGYGTGTSPSAEKAPPHDHGTTDPDRSTVDPGNES